MGVFSRDVGVDLGTAQTKIYIRGRGIVLKEPSVVSINKITDEILAVGENAKEMIGRTPDNIKAIKPLKGGVIANFYATKKMLNTFIGKVSDKSLFKRSRIVVTIPSGVTDVEERALEEVVYSTGAKEVYLMESAMAAAIGAGLRVDTPEGIMVVDIGAGTTEIAVISLGGIVESLSVRLAGDDMDEDIIEYIKNKYNVIIGITAAEEIKLTIGAAYSSMTEEKMDVKGRDIGTGLPVTIVVTTSDIQSATKRVIDDIIRKINDTLEKTPPEIASDVMNNGVILAGGGALIKNIDRHISDVLDIPVHIANNPLECVVKGTGMALGNIETLKKAVKNRRR